MGTLVLVLLRVVVFMLHPPVFTLTQTPTWSQTYGGEEADAAYALIQTIDGGYALAGGTASYGAGNIDYWLVKTDSNGIPQWNQTYGGGGEDYAYALIQTTDGGYALAGTNRSYGAGDYDFWLVKTDSSGRTQWNQTYVGRISGRGRWDIAYALIQTTDGGYALTGRTGSYSLFLDSWLVKTDSNGIPQWNQTYGGEEDDAARALIQTTDGGYVLAGTTVSYGAGGYDCWLVKIESISFPIAPPKTEGMTSTRTEEITFPITGLRYLAIVVIGTSVGLLSSRLVYRRYDKRRQKRTSSKELREDVN